jgi:hypothetical protein
MSATIIAFSAAANSAGSPPPCGEGSGVGVGATTSLDSRSPPTLTLPHKGGGNDQRNARRLETPKVGAHPC